MFRNTALYLARCKLLHRIGEQASRPVTVETNAKPLKRQAGWLVDGQGMRGYRSFRLLFRGRISYLLRGSDTPPSFGGVGADAIQG